MDVIGGEWLRPVLWTWWWWWCVALASTVRLERSSSSTTNNNNGNNTILRIGTHRSGVDDDRLRTGEGGEWYGVVQYCGSPPGRQRRRRRRRTFTPRNNDNNGGGGGAIVVWTLAAVDTDTDTDDDDDIVVVMIRSWSSSSKSWCQKKLPVVRVVVQPSLCKDDDDRSMTTPPSWSPSSFIFLRRLGPSVVGGGFPIPKRIDTEYSDTVYGVYIYIFGIDRKGNPNGSITTDVVYDRCGYNRSST